MPRARLRGRNDESMRRRAEAGRGSSLARHVLAERSLGRREAGDWDAERRAGDVVERELVAEGDRGRVAAVLAADADLELVARLPATLDADAHQLADALAVDGDEGIAGKNA